MSQPVPVSAVEVITSGYVAAHGFEPRGIGSWAFGPERNTPADSLDMIWIHHTTFGAAKLQARRIFAAMGVTTVYVQS